MKLRCKFNSKRLNRLKGMGEGDIGDQTGEQYSRISKMFNPELCEYVLKCC